MKAIHANPKRIREIFNSSYEIPEFQRRYSWEKNECDTLWNDIFEHFEKIKENIKGGENYYLGTIVVYKDNRSKYMVIDGQQRLTSLLLLIRAFLSKNVTFDALRECIYEKDLLTAKFSSNIRLVSKVIDDDKQAFESTIEYPEKPQVENSTTNRNFRSNYNFFYNRVKELPESDMSSFIETLLDKVVLLPIETESEDHALTIFERLNDTGLALSDTDIFKSKLFRLYSDLNQSEKKFVTEWNALKDHEILFRVHMHYCRARDGVIDSEIGLRTFINHEIKKKNKNPDDIFSLIKRSDLINNYDLNETMSIKRRILQRHANNYWNFPIYIWLLQNAEFSEDGFKIPSFKNSEFVTLLDVLHRFCVVKGITHKTVNAEKTHIYHLCKDIFSQNTDYLIRLREQINSDKNDFLKLIDDSQQIGRYMGLLVFTIASLNPNQKPDQFLKFLKQNDINLEHILPRKWADCNDWDKQSADDHIDRIANMVLLENKLNIKASNDFFQRKKEIYRNSDCQDAQDLCAYDRWNANSVADRHEKIKLRLSNWIDERR